MRRAAAAARFASVGDASTHRAADAWPRRGVRHAGRANRRDVRNAARMVE
jgi:hypothetical protein